MPIVLNTNASATEATFNLSKANDNLRKSIARLSSGNRITKPTDDAGGMAVAYKLQSSVKRTEANINNHQNALSLPTVLLSRQYFQQHYRLYRKYKSYRNIKANKYFQGIHQV